MERVDRVGRHFQVPTAFPFPHTLSRTELYNIISFLYIKLLKDCIYGKEHSDESHPPTQFCSIRESPDRFTLFNPPTKRLCLKEMFGQKDGMGENTNTAKN